MKAPCSLSQPMIVTLPSASQLSVLPAAQLRTAVNWLPHLPLDCALQSLSQVA